MRAHRISIAVAAAAAALAACGQGGGSAELKPEDRRMGDPDAPVTVIEYASITCSACKGWHDLVWPQFKEEFVDTGKVQFVLRELPTQPMDVSVAGFMVARCAPEDRYFNVIDILFERQQQLFQSADRRGELLAIARAAGLTEEQFESCIRNEAEVERINASAEEAATRYRISSTPGFVINGRSFVGAEPIEVFRERIAEAAGEPLPEPETTEATEGQAQ